MRSEEEKEAIRNWRHPKTGETRHEFSSRRIANAAHGLWLCDNGDLIPIEQRSKHERSQRQP